MNKKIIFRLTLALLFTSLIITACADGPSLTDDGIDVPECSDGIDNDNDGLIDYGDAAAIASGEADPECSSPDDVSEADDVAIVGGSGNANDSVEEAVDDSSDDDKAPDLEVVDSDDFVEESCSNVPKYVPCGSFMMVFESGTMTCTDFQRTLEASPNELLTLIPGNNGDQLMAIAAGIGEGTVLLVQVSNEGLSSKYSGPLVNSEGITVSFTFSYFSNSPDPGGFIEPGELKVVVNNPAGTGGTCTMVRAFSGIQ